MLTVPGLPEQIKALAMTSDSIMVAWTRPLEPNGNIIKYNVYYRSLLHKVSFRTKFPNSTLDVCVNLLTAEIVKNIPEFYCSWKFIIMFSSVHYWTLS
jgi:hypothetical protein